MLKKFYKKYIQRRFQYSQAGQDIFALNLSGKSGTYLEVGAFQPKLDSNTYLLEVENNWSGLSIELKQSLKQEWKACNERSNPIYFSDALSFDYKKYLIQNNLPMHINYFSCDIDPAENTFIALKCVIESGISFDFISYEHDDYVNKGSYHQIACDYLIPKGYKIAIDNVFPRNKKKKIFETWFVNKDIDFKKMEFIEWKKNNI